MPLALQLHLVMTIKYSKFGVDTFNTFWIVATLKILQDEDHNDDDNNDDLAIKMAQLFLPNRRAKKGIIKYKNILHKYSFDHISFLYDS